MSHASGGTSMRFGGFHVDSLLSGALSQVARDRCRHPLRSVRGMRICRHGGKRGGHPLRSGVDIRVRGVSWKRAGAVFRGVHFGSCEAVFRWISFDVMIDTGVENVC